MSRYGFAVAALCAPILFAVGCAPTGTLSAGPSATSAGRVAGVTTCALATLPSEVDDTVRIIHEGGPFPFPRNDGVVFGNREGHLPEQRRGYYHEYTVITPGARNRSTKRVITGGAPLTDPPQYFYTGDHYDSFCAIVDAKGPR